MAENSKIEWTDHTFNPWRGCTKVAAGCANCYADSQAKRNPGTLGIWGDHGTRVVASESMWKQPEKWNRAAGELPSRPRVFCASMADVFEDWRGQACHSSGVPMWMMHQYNGHLFRWGAGHVLDDPSSGRLLSLYDLRARLFETIDETPNLDWLLLTKRPENIRHMWPSFTLMPPTKRLDYALTFPTINVPTSKDVAPKRRNVWLGTSIATQEDAERNIPELLNCRDLAPVLFLSIEPLLEPVDLQRAVTRGCPNGNRCELDKATGHRIVQDSSEGGMWVECACSRLGKIDWVIVGGESGPRLMM